MSEVLKVPRVPIFSKPVSIPCSPVLSSSPTTTPDFLVPSFDFSMIHSLQQSCLFMTTMKNSSSLSVVSVPHNSGSLLCDNSIGALRPLVLEVLCKPLFHALHNVSHSGVKGSLILISACFVCETFRSSHSSSILKILPCLYLYCGTPAV